MLKTLLAAALATAPVLSQGLAYPSDLQPGDQYRVLFVTDSTRDATSANINDYDAFVTTDASAVPFLAALDTNWRAVASVPGTAAPTHTGTAGGGGVPIYRPDGVRFANDYGNLWGGWVLSAPEITASGALVSDQVWTGTISSGLGSNVLGGTAANGGLVGYCSSSAGSWTSAGTSALSNSHRMYGISDVLTVPHPDYPHDLQPGDQYRILLVTDSSRDATSADINDYDDFVTADVQAAPEMLKCRTNWRAVASTPTVDARAHTETAPGTGDVPIYRPDGVRLANDYAHFWGTGSGSGPLLAQPNITASGVVTPGYRAWSGTLHTGVASFLPLGDPGGNAMSGDPNTTNYSWMVANPFVQGINRPLYGISDVITVPEPRHPQGLQPGQQYRVLSVTTGTRDATSADIADYDAFVTADAESVPAMRLLGTAWRAVASTPTVTAKAHTETDSGAVSVPIYRPDGVLLANSYGQWWGGNSLAASPNVNSLGSFTPATGVWTGSRTDGTIFGRASLGGSNGSNASVYGIPTSTRMGSWVEWITAHQSQQRPLYAISDVITVPLTATETIRVGSPANPLVFHPGQSSKPVIGQTWDPVVNHEGWVQNAVQDYLLLGLSATNQPLPGFGTLLCDQRLSVALAKAPNLSFSVPIPNDTNLVGLQLCTQVVAMDPTPSAHLTNAIDITIGTR